MNFGHQVADVFEEIRLWSSVGYSLPQAAKQLEMDADRMQLLRCSVAALVQLHNEVWRESLVLEKHSSHEGLEQNRSTPIMIGMVHQSHWP